MPKIVCAKCHLDYQPLLNGVRVIDMAFDPPAPYHILNGDAWFCPGCNHVVIAGFPDAPRAGIYHHEPGFEKELESTRSSLSYKEGLSVEVYEHPKDVPDELRDHQGN